MAHFGARILIGVALLASCAMLGCAPRSSDTPPFQLTNEGSMSRVDVIEKASAPSGYPGAAGFVYSVGPGRTSAEIVYRDLASGESVSYPRGVWPSLCSSGVYFYEGALKYITGPDAEPVTIGVQGYERVLASPNDRWLLLYAAPSASGSARIALNDRAAGVTRPFTGSGELDTANPEWASDTTVYADGVAPEGSGADRAVYRFDVPEDGPVTVELVKLAAVNPDENGAGLLACLERMEGQSQQVIAVYDLEQRTRVAWVPPPELSTFADVVWVADDLLAAQVDTQEAGGSSIRLYRVEE